MYFGDAENKENNGTEEIGLVTPTGVTANNRRHGMATETLR